MTAAPDPFGALDLSSTSNANGRRAATTSPQHLIELRQERRPTTPFSRLLALAVFLLSLFAALHPAPSWSASSSVSTDHARVSLISASSHLQPGTVQTLALKIEPADGWHTYWRNPGEVGKPTQITWQLPSGVKAGEIEWPLPTRKVDDGGISFVYEGEHILPLAIAVNDQLDFDRDSQTFIAHAEWLICKDLCIPESATLSLSLPIAHPSASEDSLRSEAYDDIENALSIVPALARSIDATFSAMPPRSDDEPTVLTVKVDSGQLPPFKRQPRAFVAEQAIVNEAVLADIHLDDEALYIQFEKDSYLEELPPYFALVLMGFDDASLPGGALELHVEASTEPLASFKQPLASDNPLSAPSKQSSTGTLSPSNGVDNSPKFSNGFFGALILAFLGGVILNAMPCVFPVLSLKILSLVDSAHTSPRHRQLHGLYYTLGVLVSFLLVAGALIALRAVGEQIGWGFQMQSPVFVGAMVIILFVLGLSLSGAIELGTSLQNLGGSLAANEEKPLTGAFWTGVLATVVATPCTAPFMGTAIGYALSQPAWVSLSVFTAMALGLAAPFLLIAFVPVLQTILPRPGQWMNTLKEALAFPLYLTAVWLLWVFARQTGSDAVALLLLALVTTAMTVWAFNKRTTAKAQGKSSSIWTISAVLFALLTLLFAYVANTQSSSHSAANAAHIEPLGKHQKDNAAGQFIAFSQASLEAEIARGNTVLVNMTADWCITCKVNEKVALNSSKVIERLQDIDVSYIKGDWTNSDPAITAYLESFGRNGVPLYVVYKSGEAPRILPQILTSQLVIDALQ